MAGSLTTPIRHRRVTTTTPPEDSRWLISYARFIPYPSAPSSNHPALFPLGKREVNPPPHGTWLSTYHSTVSLQIIDEINTSGSILSASLAGKILEEHYVSKLNFSWPQMTCVSGFPPRGSRAILVSYKDSENEIQKFALRFSTCEAAETFVVVLKEKLKGLEGSRIQRSVRSEISYQSDYNNTLNEIFPRANVKVPNMVRPLESYAPERLPRLVEDNVEESNMINPFDSYVPEMVPRLEYEAGQALYQLQSTPSQNPTLEYVAGQTPYQPQPKTPVNLPPSFATLLSSCFPNSTQVTSAAGQPTPKQDPDLKNQIMKYMEDSAFQDMLQRVETIIDEIGSNWIV